ncbi:hypothetical protein [Methanolobus sp. WCC4]|uniref:hypothetical protein n=1 Tax=Methanolobus sp. WCC4 TaxID=3125784 RepID=UPI0030F8003B
MKHNIICGVKAPADPVGWRCGDERDVKLDVGHDIGIAIELCIEPCIEPYI